MYLFSWQLLWSVLRHGQGLLLPGPIQNTTLPSGLTMMLTVWLTTEMTVFLLLLCSLHLPQHQVREGHILSQIPLTPWAMSLVIMWMWRKNYLNISFSSQRPIHLPKSLRCSQSSPWIHHIASDTQCRTRFVIFLSILYFARTSSLSNSWSLIIRTFVFGNQ